MSRYLQFHAAIATLASLVSLANAQQPMAEAKSREAKPAEATSPAAKPAEPLGVPAALEERYQKLAEHLQQALPKREIKVKVVEKQKTPLLRADPKLFESKFVGTLMLRPAGLESANEQRMQDYFQRLGGDQHLIGQYPLELKQLLFFGDMSLRHVGGRFSQLVRPRVVFDTELREVSDRFQLLFKQCAPELVPEKPMMDYLTSAECDRDVGQSIEPFKIQFSDANIAQQQLTYRVLAPTAEQAEERMRAIVRLYDAGLSRPMQQFLLSEGQKVLEAARSGYVEMAQLTQAAQAEREKLAVPSEISGDILSQLKAQKVMVAVELAGLNARVKACDAMLADPKKLEISTLQSISDMKIKAEIERVGIKEKLDQINVYIAEGDLRAGAFTRQVELGQKLDRLRSIVKARERTVTEFADVFELYAPFQIPDDQISIGPIEWSQE